MVNELDDWGFYPLDAQGNPYQEVGLQHGATFEGRVNSRFTTAWNRMKITSVATQRSIFDRSVNGDLSKGIYILEYEQPPTKDYVRFLDDSKARQIYKSQPRDLVSSNWYLDFLVFEVLESTQPQVDVWRAANLDTLFRTKLYKVAESTTSFDSLQDFKNLQYQYQGWKADNYLIGVSRYDTMDVDESRIRYLDITAKNDGRFFNTFHQNVHHNSKNDFPKGMYAVYSQAEGLDVNVRYDISSFQIKRDLDGISGSDTLLSTNSIERGVRPSGYCHLIRRISSFTNSPESNPKFPEIKVPSYMLGTYRGARVYTFKLDNSNVNNNSVTFRSNIHGNEPVNTSTLVLDTKDPNTGSLHGGLARAVGFLKCVKGGGKLKVSRSDPQGNYLSVYQGLTSCGFYSTDNPTKIIMQDSADGTVFLGLNLKLEGTGTLEGTEWEVVYI